MVASRSVRAGATRSPLVRAYVGLSHATAFFIFVQALLAGDWARSGTMPVLHEMIANLVFLLAAALVAVGFLVGKQGAAPTATVLGFSVALAVLVIAQIGLGYAGRTADGRDLLGLHLPLGVLLFGLAVANSVAVTRLIRS